MTQAGDASLVAPSIAAGGRQGGWRKPLSDERIAHFVKRAFGETSRTPREVIRLAVEGLWCEDLATARHVLIAIVASLQPGTP
jgi:hypothetical protein